MDWCAYLSAHGSAVVKVNLKSFSIRACPFHRVCAAEGRQVPTKETVRGQGTSKKTIAYSILGSSSFDAPFQQKKTDFPRPRAATDDWLPYMCMRLFNRARLKSSLLRKHNQRIAQPRIAIPSMAVYHVCHVRSWTHSKKVHVSTTQRDRSPVLSACGTVQRWT